MDYNTANTPNQAPDPAINQPQPTQPPVTPPQSEDLISISPEVAPIPNMHPETLKSEAAEIPSTNIETTPEIPVQQEVMQTSEIVKPTPLVQPQGTDDDNNEQPTQTIQQETKPQVVDKRNYHEKLGSVNQNADELTTIADLEEEDFILEVEKHHEHQ